MKIGFYTPEQVANRLNRNPQVIRRWLREGRIQATKISGAWLVPEGEIERLEREREEREMKKLNKLLMAFDDEILEAILGEDPEAREKLKKELGIDKEEK